MLEAALCDRRLKLLRQLPQGQLRVGLPQDDGLLQLGGEPAHPVQLVEPPDGLQLLLGGGHHLVQVGGLAVDLTVHAVAQPLLRPGALQCAGGSGCAHESQELLDLDAAFEVGDLTAAPGRLAGLAAHVGQQRRQLPAGLGVAGDQLQVVALGGLGGAAAGKERAPQKRGAAAVLLQQAEVDVEHRALAGVEAKGVHDAAGLLPVRDLKDVFLLPLRRQAVKGEAKGPVQKGGEPLREALALRDDPHLLGGKGVAVEQRTVGLRPGAARISQRRLA